MKGGRRYRYYAAPADGNGSGSFRIAAGDIEPVVIRQIVAFLGRTGELVDGWVQAGWARTCCGPC